MNSKESKKKQKRRSARYKASIVLEVLRGQPIEEITRREGIGVHEIDQWHEIFIKHGLHGFKKDPEQSKLREAQHVIGRLAMENELLKKKLGFNRGNHGK